MSHDYEDMPGHLARRFQQIAVAVFQAEMSAIGADITPIQYVTLEVIKANPKLDQATLSGIVALDRTTITGVTDRLENKALIRREKNVTDRRSKELEITPKGTTLLTCLKPHVEAAQKRMTSGLTKSETQELLRLLRKAVNAGNDLSRAPQRQ